MSDSMMEFEQFVQMMEQLNVMNKTMNEMTFRCVEKCTTPESTLNNFLTEREGQCVINCANGILSTNAIFLPQSNKSLALFKL